MQHDIMARELCQVECNSMTCYRGLHSKGRSKWVGLGFRHIRTRPQIMCGTGSSCILRSYKSKPSSTIQVSIEQLCRRTL